MKSKSFSSFMPNEIITDEIIKLTVYKYDKSQYKEDEKAPEFCISLRSGTTWAYKKEEILPYVEMELKLSANPEAYKFKPIELVSKLEGEEYADINANLEKRVNQYNALKP